MATATIAASAVRISGPGLHSGAAAAVHVTAPGAPAATPSVLDLPGGGTLSLFSPFGECALKAERGTVLWVHGQPFRGPEHLLAALVAYPFSGLRVLCEGGEVPNLDGSALPFFKGMASCLPGGFSGAAPKFRLYESGLVGGLEWEGGYFYFEPGETFSVRYEWSCSSGAWAAGFDLAEGDWVLTYLNSVLPARTFIEWKDFESAHARGLVKGAGARSGLLLADSREEYARLVRSRPDLSPGPYPFAHLPGSRMPGEPAWHKILDLLGDLALVGLALPRLRIHGRNAGHVHHHHLVKELLHEHTDVRGIAAS